jgi:hypothetical protein
MPRDSRNKNFCLNRHYRERLFPVYTVETLISFKVLQQGFIGKKISISADFSVLCSSSANFYTSEMKLVYHEIWRRNSRIHQLAEASEEGQVPRRAVEPLMMRWSWYSNKTELNNCVLHTHFGCVSWQCSSLFIKLWSADWCVIYASPQIGNCHYFLCINSVEQCPWKRFQSLSQLTSFRLLWINKFHYRAHRSIAVDPVLICTNLHTSQVLNAANLQLASLCSRFLSVTKYFMVKISDAFIFLFRFWAV